MEKNKEVHLTQLSVSEAERQLIVEGLLALADNDVQAMKLVKDQDIQAVLQRHIEYIQRLNQKVCGVEG